MENRSYEEVFNAVRDGSLSVDEFENWAWAVSAERYSVGYNDGWDAANE